MVSLDRIFRVMFQRFLSLFIIFLLSPSVFPQEDLHINPAPNVIPSVQEWEGSSGYYELNDNETISVYNSSYTKLEKTIKLFVKDLVFFSDRDYKVVTTDLADKGIILCLNDVVTSYGESAYKLTIDSAIRLEANTVEGIILGTRTILQLIDIYGNKIPRGQVIDYPDYPRRGFMLDVGRKFFTLEFLQDYIKILSYYKMNEFHIHLNDNGFKQFFDNDWNKTYSAFRLESETYPGLEASDGYYTKEDFRELQKLGMKYGVNVIPEIDVPAHSLAFTKYKPEIGSKKYGMDHLDINKKETYEFVDKLFDEYLGGDNPVFIGPDVHIGTDEYAKEEAESFRKFTDHYLRKVQSYGKRARLWGALTHADGDTPVTSENVIMNAWYNGYADPQDMMDQGYELISTSDRHLYIVPAAGYYYDYLNLEFLYNEWGPHLIGGDTFMIKHPQISGGMFAVWNDHCGNGISEKDVHHRAFPALQVLAQKMWYGNQEGRSFGDFISTADQLSEAPGLNLMGKIDDIAPSGLYYNFRDDACTSMPENGVRTASKSVWVPGKGYKFKKNYLIISPLEEIGYPYEVSFDVTFSKRIKEAVMFLSDNAAVTVKPVDGKVELGFKRDGYYYNFNHLLETNKCMSLTVKGDHKGTSLLVDGVEVERLEGLVEEYKKENGQDSNMYIQQTLVFPLRTIGNFRGVLHSLKVISK